MKRGKFITIEGVEGAGKSTALLFIKAYLSAAQPSVLLTREPGGTEIAEKIRLILLSTDVSESLQPETETLLMFACRAQHIRHCILPALQSGTWVVSDRYVDASYAYQGGGRGVSAHQIQSLDRWVVGNLYPDLTLLMDIPVDQGLVRAQDRGLIKDRIEEESIDFFNAVRHAYLARAQQDPKRIKIIDASLALPDVQKQLREALDEFLKQSD